MIVELKDISDSIKSETGVDIINNTTRLRVVADAKRLYGIVSRELTTKSLSAIGNHINKNHATIMHYCKTAKSLIETDKEFRELYNKCITKLDHDNKEVLENLKKYHEEKVYLYTIRLKNIKDKTE